MQHVHGNECLLRNGVSFMHKCVDICNKLGKRRLYIYIGKQSEGGFLKPNFKF